MSYLVCSMPTCNLSAHGSHDANGRNLCKKCYAAYLLGISHHLEYTEGKIFTYKVGGETWEKA